MILIFWQYGAFGKTMCYLGFLWFLNALIFLSYRGAVCGDRAVMFLLEDDYLNHPEMLAEVVRPGRKVTANKFSVHVIFLSFCYILCAGFSCWWRLVKRWFASRRWLELFWGRYKQRQHRARRVGIISERVLAPNNQTISGHRRLISRNCCAVERLSLQKVVIRRKDWKVNGNAACQLGMFLPLFFRTSKT